jgi:hypothetical protein
MLLVIYVSFCVLTVLADAMNGTGCNIPVLCAVDAVLCCVASDVSTVGVLM